MTPNPEDVIRMAREAGFEELFKDSHDWVCFTEEIERFAALVAAAEREACARIAEEPSAMTYECTVACGGPEQTFQQRMPKHAHEIANAIRARGQS